MPKKRVGFVSNSSSSSFIIIADGGMDDNIGEYEDKTLVIDQYFGETEFGWENVKYCSISDKIIFSYLQTRYANNDKWLAMLEDMIKEETGCICIEWKFSDDYPTPDGTTWAYIDHQSNAAEGENTEMFNSEEDLRNFIFNSDSFIQGGNDNE